MSLKKKKAWIVTIDIGYGHQRAAYQLKDIAYERIIIANNDKVVPRRELKLWKAFKSFYNGISRIASLPLVGEFFWKFYDRFQSISPYYPFRDLSKPNLGSLYYHTLIRRNFGKSIVDYTRKKKIPFVSTFPLPALAASHAGLKDVYCVVTDTDVQRYWVPENPKKEKLYYLTPTEHSTKRIIAYGVPKEKVFFTGFPLPKENLGKNLEILKKDLGYRLPNLDPKRTYINRYKETLRKRLGKDYRARSDHPLTIAYAVGGAGAQKEVGASILRSLKKHIKNHKLRLILVGGIRLEVAEYFNKVIKELGLTSEKRKFVDVLCTTSKETYFKKFNEMLHTTDILWTKPSELSFYTALGLPIIITKPLGTHEERNQKWLVRMGTGFVQENPEYVNEWLFEWLNKGILAEAAWEGYTEAPRYGTYNIEKIIFSKNKEKIKLKY